ncbi:Lead, cadmium, zinc and mercury transporting ATPase [Minicystis rosea]|nr:Lead, cadmium, zinc and mercury transporting ATPase [Minicystis rosea]
MRTATVRWREERADVRFDVQRTSESDLAAALIRAGYDVRDTSRAARAPGVDLAIALVALANIMLLAVRGGSGRAVFVAELALASIAVLAAGAALGRRAIALLRRGLLDRDALALAAATAVLGLGLHDLLAHRAPSGGLAGLGLRLAPRPPEPGSGFVAAAAIAVAALAMRFVEDALRRRARRDLDAALEDRAPAGRSDAGDAEVRAALARLTEAEATPPDGTWEDAAVRGIITAALGCASFALVTHGCLGGGPLGPLAVTAAIAVLVVASPSMILAAAPAARAIAVLRARAAGVIVKDPAALVALAAVDVACLEKNGTVTSARRHVRDVVWMPGVLPDLQLIADVAALEQLSAHPAGRAVAAYLAAARVDPTPLGADARVTESPNGIAGRMRGALVEVGSPARFGLADHDGTAGTSAVVFGRNGVAHGRFELHTPLRENAIAAIQALSARGVRPLLLSGDAPAATAQAARHLGIPASGGLGPAEKALAIRDLQVRGARVLLVGDGSRDAAFGAQADVSIAVAPDTLPGAVRARIVLTDDRIDRLPALVDLGRSLRAVLRQNAAFATVYNAVLIPAAALGYVPPLLAAGLALLETMLGLANAARLLRARVGA